MSAELLTCTAFLFPATGNARLFDLSITKEVMVDVFGYPRATLRVHPEQHAGGFTEHGWESMSVDTVCGEKPRLKHQFVIFYRNRPRSGRLPIPVNQCISALDIAEQDEASAWRGDVIVAKYTRDGDIMHCTVSDYLLVRLILSFHVPR